MNSSGKKTRAKISLKKKLAIRRVQLQRLEKIKQSLGKLLIEGLYQVTRKYRYDPFKCLGQWLLIQADIRDEIKICHS